MTLTNVKDEAALFKIDADTKAIIHNYNKNEQIWHPEGGSTNPKEEARIVLFNSSHSASKFILADRSGVQLNAKRDESV